MAYFAAAGGLLAAMALFEPYNTEKAYRFERPQEVPRDHLTLRTRLGYAVLLRSGYADLHQRPEPSRGEGGEGEGEEEGAGTLGEEEGTLGEEEGTLGEEAKEANLSLFVNEDHPDFSCMEPAEPVSVRGSALDVKRLTMAIVAAEKYNRGSFQRRMEGWIAGLSLRLRGRLPEFSYGLAQIRPATARALLEEELGGLALSNRDLRALLLEPCQNVRLAGRYVDRLSRRFADSDSVGAAVVRVAETYNGASSSTLHGLRYADAVAGAYALLVRDEYGEEVSGEGGAGEEGAEAEGAAACVTWKPGRVAAAEDTAALRALLGLAPGASAGERASAKIYAVHGGPGPPAYIAGLAERRKAWLTDALAGIGFSRARISFDPAGSAGSCGGTAFAAVRASGLAAPETYARIPALLEEGTRLFQGGDFQGAARVFAQVAEIDPQNRDALYRQAHALHQLGAWRELAIAGAALYRVDPLNREAADLVYAAYVGLREQALLRGDTAQAKQYLNSAEYVAAQFRRMPVFIDRVVLVPGERTVEVRGVAARAYGAAGTSVRLRFTLATPAASVGRADVALVVPVEGRTRAFQVTVPVSMLPTSYNYYQIGP
jgi:tetratricopeptide (TPR) repeat protein